MGACLGNYRTMVNAASVIAVTVVFFLIVIKSFAWYISESLTVKASLLDSFSDFFSSLINLFAVRYAIKPANEKYKFGHGKAEALAGFFQSLLIMGSAIWVMSHAFSHDHIKNVVNESNLVLLLMCLCSLLTLCLVVFQKYVIKQTKSVAVMSDHLHYQGDLFGDAAAIIAIIAAKYFKVFWLDSLLSLLISGILFWGCLRIFKSSFNILMDRELPKDTLQAILKTIATHPAVKEVHDLRTRSCGIQEFVQVHISLDPYLSLEHAHAIGDEVEKLLLKLLPNAQILIHLDPFGIEINQNI
jgi:ferrous-iron efflux pump FieF